MDYPDFIGGSQMDDWGQVNARRSINLYTERPKGGTPRLRGTPGKTLFAAITGASSVPAIYTDPVTGRVFAAAGNALYEVLQTGRVSPIYGALGNGPYSFSSANSKQMMISCAGSNTAYIFDLAASTLSRITAEGFLGSISNGMIDDYFLSLVPESREFQISTLLDGTQWDGLDFGSSSGGADNILAFSATHRELWLFAGTRGEVYIDDGNANFPFERLEGAALDVGIIAPQSLLRMDNTLYWLGQDAERGAGVVYRANGYTPERVSNELVEWYISQYAKHATITDAIAWSYTDEGHSFYVLQFPSANLSASPAGGSVSGTGAPLGATWVLDRATGEWHERAYLANGILQADIAACHCYAWGQHLVGDRQSGNIYVLSSDAYDDAGTIISRIRRAPVLNRGQKRNGYGEFAIDAQMGVGSSAEPNPACSLRISNDGGETWGAYRTRSLGQIGQYSKRLRWTGGGSGRRRAYEWSTTARVPISLAAPTVDTQEGIS